jgi:uncharacterized protein YndB with AHSA1/START domain
MPAVRDIRFSVPVKAKPDEVYKALTSARELTRWWLLGAETDARNAGRVRMVWPRVRGRDGVRAEGLGEREGVFVDLEPARTSVFMLPAGRKGSEVTLVHAGFPGAKSADRLYLGYARAWEDGLAKLKLYLETGRTCKMETLDLEAARILGREAR